MAARPSGAGALPAQAQRPCDTYELSATDLSSTGRLCYASRFVDPAGDLMLRMPSWPSEPTVETVPGFNVSWLEDSAASAYLVGLGQEEWRITLMQSASLPTSVELPLDALVPGWPALQPKEALPVLVDLGVIYSSGSAWQTLLAWEQVNALGRFPEHVPPGVSFAFAITQHQARIDAGASEQ